MRFGVTLLGLVVGLGIALASSALLQAEEPATGTLVVVVQTPEGPALEGAFVLVWSPTGNWAVPTDAEGRAVLEALEPGTYQVMATARGRIAADADDREVEAGGKTVVTLEMAAGVPFQGRVLDPDGEPVAGAYVSVRAGGSFGGYCEMFAAPDTYARTWTDEEGVFQVGGLPDGRVATVRVEAEGYEEARVGVRAMGETVRPSPLEIHLVRGGRITGLVRDPEGLPAPHAVVYAVPAEDEGLRENPRIQGWSSDGTMRSAWTARADEEGRYEIRGLPLGGTYVVAAEFEPHARSPWSPPFRPTAGRWRGKADLVLRAPAEIHVHLVVPEGLTLGWKRVELGAHLSGLHPVEDERGHVQIFRRLWPGIHHLTVHATGFLPSERDIEVEEGERVDVDILLDAGVAITGVLLDESGEPVEGARIDAERKVDDETGWHPMSVSHADTDADGRFALAGLRPGLHEITASKRGFDLLAPVRMEAPATNLTLHGVHLGTLVVRFVRPDGTPAEGKATLWRWRPEGSGSRSTTRLHDGEIALLGFRGKERLTFDLDGYVRVTRKVDVSPGEHKDLGEVTLDVGLDLEGRVLDAGGKPVPAAQVSHDGYTRTETDAKGAFRLPHVPAGPVEIDVDAEGFLAATVVRDASVQPAPPPIRLSRGTVLKGVVRDPEGRPLDGTWFEIQREDETGTWREEDGFGTEDDGTFEIRVKTGRSRIAVVEDRDAPPIVLRTIDGKEGEVLQLALVLAKPAAGTPEGD